MAKRGQYKITVKFQKRPDGGLRAWSPDIPGLVLSNKDPESVVAGVGPAIEVILEERLGCHVRAFQLEALPHAAVDVKPILAAPVTTRTRQRKAAYAGVLVHGRRTLEFAAACG